MQKDPGHFQVLIFRREENVFLNSGTKKILTDRIHNILLSSNWCRIPYRDTLRILPILLSRNPRKKFGVQEPVLDRSRVPLRVSMSEMCGNGYDGNCDGSFTSSHTGNRTNFSFKTTLDSLHVHVPEHVRVHLLWNVIWNYTGSSTGSYLAYRHWTYDLT